MSTARKYPNVIRAVTEYPWAILPGHLDAILDVLEIRLDGRRLTEEEIEARIGKPSAPPVAQTVESVALIPVFGMLAHRMNLMTAMSGGMSTELLGQAIRVAVEEPSVKAILLDVDSPGGSVFGIQELGDEIFSLRGRKPIVAVANATAASAAYWLASQADQLLVTPSGMVGSIGVIATHVDRSKQAEMLGLKHTIITAGKHKADGSDLGPLDDPSMAAMQRKVDQYYDTFVRAVARGRGATVRDVREGFGEGRVVTAKDAVSLGMVDGVATMDQAIASLVAGQSQVPIPGHRAEAAGELEAAPEDEIADFRLRLAALV